MNTVFWDMAARIATRYGLDDPGRQESFSLFQKVQTGSRAHSASYSMCTGVGRPGREVDHPHLSKAEVKNELVSNFADLCAFMV
jgi:hypothetical protein